MDTRRFYELNNQKSIPYETYFGEMLISKAQKENRIRLALILEDWIAIAFELFRSQLANGLKDTNVVKQTLMDGLLAALDDVGVDDTSRDNWDNYIVKTANDIVDVTEKRHEPDSNNDYWLSDDRVKFIAEDQSNGIWAHKEYLDAVKQGKARKTWVAIFDSSTRHTHLDANRTEIPIDEYFEVGEALLLYPKDTTSEYSTGAEHPEEIVNCRCSCTYS